MNHVYKVVWNDVQSVWQCVSELTRSHSKKSQRERQERIASVQTQPTSFNQRAVMLALAAIFGGVMVSPSALAATDGQNGTNQDNVNYVVTRDDGNTTPVARAKFSAVYKQVNPKPGSYAADATDGSNGDAGSQGTDGAVNPANAKTGVSVSATIASGSITGDAGTSGGNGGTGSAGGNGGNGGNGAGHLDGSGQQKGYNNNTETNEIATAAALVGQPVLSDLVDYAPQNVNAWSGFVFHGGRGGNGGAGGTGGQGGAGGQGGQGQTGLWIHSGSQGPVTYTASQGVVISGGAGGAGGTGGQGGQGGNGGNGGNGGVGANLNTDGSASAYTAMRDAGGLEGGKGGNAGKGGAGGAGGNGGNGGNGGVGVFVDGQTLVLAGTVNGGAGGTAGQAGQSGENGDHGAVGTGGKNGVLRINATAIYEGGNAANGTRPDDNDFNGASTTTPTAGQYGQGGSGVLLEHQATLVLQSGANIAGGVTLDENQRVVNQGKAIETDTSGNTVQLDTDLTKVTLTGGVSGSGNTLLLKGTDDQAYTITGTQIGENFGQGFFAVLKKDGASTWTIQGDISNGFTEKAELLAGTTKFADGSAFNKTVGVKNSATMVLDKNATVAAVDLQDSATLETNLEELNGLDISVAQDSLVTLKTTDNFTSSAKVHEFENWTLTAGTSTAEGATQLAKGTTSVENGAELTVKNVTLGANQTLTKQTGGTLTFEGESNFDNGTLTIDGDGAQFSERDAVLVTNKTSGDGIQNNLFGVNSSVTIGNKDKATLRTKGAFEAKEGFAHQFNKWEVQGTGSKATHADQLAKETDVQSGGALTLTDVTLGEGQTLALSGGDLTFAGLTNLDEGTKSFTSGVYRFANEAVLETAKASLADVLVNVNAMETAAGATLRTKGEAFTSSADVTKFGTWEVQGAATTATGADQLAKVTDVQSGGVMTITDLTLGSTQTLKLTGGDLTFAGTTNLDQGTKTFTSGTYRFADQAVLETALGSLSEVLSNPSAMLDSPNATLRTKGPTFTSSADVAKFGTWEVQGAATTATGAEQLAKVTDVQSGGVMTITALTLGATQTLKLSGGDLTFAGLTNLDEGTKAFDSGKYGFADQAVLETTKASLTEVLGNVDTMEPSAGATLRTKGEAFTSSVDVTKFGTWEVQGAATTATGAEQLATVTDVQSGGRLNRDGLDARSG